MTANIIVGVVGPWQLIVIVLVVLLLFGGKKIPELMKGLGKGIREFKEGMNPEDQKKSDNNSVEKKD